MLERQEIDALLISALYGELTPSEESRLEAHLGSHPADKTALAALTSTRDAVRSSRILQVQLEPPHSVSALLLQEAARRAPKPAEGWFARFSRSFMTHPAMAAAAMLVVVIGVVTVVQNRKGDQYVETAPATAVEAKPPAADQGIVANQPAPDRAADRLENAAGSAAFGGETAEGYKVSLADADGRKLEAEKQQNTAGADRKVSGAIATPKADPSPTRVTPDDDVADKNAKKGMTKKPSDAYMELRSAEPTVKDFESNANGEVSGRTYATPPSDDLSKQNVNAVTPGPSGGGGIGNGTVSTPRGTAAPTRQQAPSTTAGPAPAAPPPPKVAPNSDTKTVAPAEEKTGNDPQLAWAREQHTAIIARVRNGDCKGAASIAVGLANRDLAYYKQNVASDRSVKECLAYIDNAREKDQEQRAERAKPAQKRSINESTTPTKPAQPPKATAVDSTK